MRTANVPYVKIRWLTKAQRFRTSHASDSALEKSIEIVPIFASNFIECVEINRDRYVLAESGEIEVLVTSEMAQAKKCCCVDEQT
jgi:hypothetical protein